jgi:hypothetical protein
VGKLDVFDSFEFTSGTIMMSPSRSVPGNHPGPLKKAESQSVQLSMDCAFSQIFL